MSQTELSPTGLKIFSVLIIAIFLLFFSIVVFSQPKAVSPSDYKRQYLLSTFSGDWSQTDQFDIENPIELPVILVGLELPEKHGHAILQFKLNITDAAAREADIDVDTVYRATLQEVTKARELNITTQLIRKGAPATIKGWPATYNSVYGTMLLVDELSIDGTDTVVDLHKNNPAMDERKNRSKLEQEKPT